MGFCWESDLWNPWNNHIPIQFFKWAFQKGSPKTALHMSSLNWVLIVWRESLGSLLGICWESAGSKLGVRWESAGSSLEVCRESAGSLLGVRWIHKMISPKSSPWAHHHLNSPKALHIFFIYTSGYLQCIFVDWSPLCPFDTSKWGLQIRTWLSLLGAY